MSDTENRQTVERYFEAIARRDLAAAQVLRHADVVVEWRLRGNDNVSAIEENYPGLPDIKSTEYFGEPFEAPQWRARWVERMKLG